MFARTVTLDLDVDKWDEVVEFGGEIRRRLSAFDGLLDWYLIADPNSGQAVSFSLFDDRGAFEAVNDEINAIVVEFSSFFVSAPEERLGEVLIALNE